MSEIENIENEMPMKYFPKYGDYFGNVLMMGYENLGIEYMRFDENVWTIDRKIDHAARYYYWLYNATLKEALDKVKLEYTSENKMKIAKVLQKYFGEDAFFHFILKGKDKFCHCEQRQERDKEL
jgi:hypothetical protein